MFEVAPRFAERVVLSRSKYDHICEKHPEVCGELEKMKETLVSPQIVRRSAYDNKVLLFYRFFRKTPVSAKYLMVAVKLSNAEGLVVTSYFTSKIMMGEEVWKEK